MEIQGVKREKTIRETQDEYSKNSLFFLYGINQINIKQWIINRYFIIEKE